MATTCKALILILIPFIFACQGEVKEIGGPVDGEYASFLDTVVVTKIVDGDTFEFIDSEYGTQEVRVLDLDTYETFTGSRLSDQARRNNISESEALELGKAARTWAQKNILNDQVIIERTNAPNRDNFDRLLRRVYWKGERYDEIIKNFGWDS